MRKNGPVKGLGVLRCLGAAVLFGASTPAASRLAGEMSALVLAGLLYLGAAIAVLPAVLRSPPSAGALRRDRKPVLLAVFTGGAVGPVLLVAGLARTSAATASILLNLELAATVLLAATIFREHLGRRVIGGAVLVTVAGTILVWQPGAEVSIGALLIAAACLAWGVDNGITAQIDQLSPAHVVFLKGLVAGGANLLLGLAFVAGGSSFETSDVMWALGIGALGYGASIVLWVKGARDLGAARGQLIFASAPFIGAGMAWVVLSEPVTGIQLLALAVAAAGVGISLESGHEHSHEHVGIEHEHEHQHDDGHHEHGHDGIDPRRRHTHRHRHAAVAHSHPHVPDLHHRHDHD